MQQPNRTHTHERYDDEHDAPSGLRRRPSAPDSVDDIRPPMSSSVTCFPYSAGKYLVSEPIASGGMASVHLGAWSDVVSQNDGSSSTEVQVVALKRLHAHLTADDYFKKMLLDEANISSRVRHRNVVTTHGVEQVDGDLFLVMEYVAGVPLNALLRTLYPSAVPARYAAAIVAGALRGLHAAHEATNNDGRSLGIVHRDVSPHNVLVGLDGVPKVFDFGIAKATQRIQTTRAGEMKGKLAYMAPEQLLGGAIDRRTDIRAAAVVLWEALTGLPLFHAESEGHTLARVLDGSVEPPSSLTPDLPPALDAIVMRGLAKRPEDRFSTALEMAEALEHLFGDALPREAELCEWLHNLGVADSLHDHERIQSDLRQRSSPPPPPDAPITMPSMAPPPIATWNAVRATVPATHPSTGPRLGRRTPAEVMLVLVLMLAAAVGGAFMTRVIVPPTPAATR